jgi:hypothetical protein
MWKNRLPDVREDLRDRYLRPHVESFFAFVEEAFVDAQHRRGMLRSALGYCRNRDPARSLDRGARRRIAIPRGRDQGRRHPPASRGG